MKHRLNRDFSRLLQGAALAGLFVAAIPFTSAGYPWDQYPPFRIEIDYIAELYSWGYYNPGDYDQNGEVNAADLTTLVRHFGKTGPFARDSVEFMVDGDGNDEINAADITVIGRISSAAVPG